MAKKGETGVTKSEAVQVALRVQQAINEILKGTRVDAIVAAMMDQYGVSKATAYAYTKEATQKIYEKIEMDVELHVNLQYKRLEYIYSQAAKDKDWRTARMILKDISELFGLDAPKRKEHFFPNGAPGIIEGTAIDVADLDEGIKLYEELKELKAKVYDKRKSAPEAEVVTDTAVEPPATD